MTYRVAIDDYSNEKKMGKMATTWLYANDNAYMGYPCAFLIDKKGVVAWFGNRAGFKRRPSRKCLQQLQPSESRGGLRQIRPGHRG